MKSAALYLSLIFVLFTARSYAQNPDKPFYRQKDFLKDLSSGYWLGFTHEFLKINETPSLAAYVSPTLQVGLSRIIIDLRISLIGKIRAPIEHKLFNEPDFHRSVYKYRAYSFSGSIGYNLKYFYGLKSVYSIIPIVSYSVLNSGDVDMRDLRQYAIDGNSVSIRRWNGILGELRVGAAVNHYFWLSNKQLAVQAAILKPVYFEKPDFSFGYQRDYYFYDKSKYLLSLGLLINLAATVHTHPLKMTAL